MADIQRQQGAHLSIQRSVFAAAELPLALRQVIQSAHVVMAVALNVRYAQCRHMDKVLVQGHHWDIGQVFRANKKLP